ncbi:Myosin-5 [Vitis vinifera]|uniref:Myosin-5 n=1 Tax=Vitis vinifera TaxID=29760 RepID=A0A438J487_VITVI|nr:Myosin-5 [Vitis vinifera]
MTLSLPSLGISFMTLRPCHYVVLLCAQLQDSAQRLEEKLSNLESDNQVLCQQALTISATAKALYARPKTPILQRTPENGNVLNGEAKKQLFGGHLKIMNFYLRHAPHVLNIHITACAPRIFSSWPIAACLIYKSLLQWRSFEVERTSVFDCIIQTIGAAIEYLKVQDNNDVLSFWLCASCISTKCWFTFLNGRVLGGLDDLRQVEAKYLALVFKQQLIAFLEKINGMIRDNLKKDFPIAWIVYSAVPHSVGYCDCTCFAIPTLQGVHSDIFIHQCSSPFELECCSFSKEEFVKSGLDELENWCHEATEEIQYAGSAWMN